MQGAYCDLLHHCIICDIACSKQYKLFVTFVDFSRAYSLVHRQVLFSVLKRLCFGTVMIGSLMSMYAVIENVVEAVAESWQ